MLRFTADGAAPIPGPRRTCTPESPPCSGNPTVCARRNAPSGLFACSPRLFSLFAAACDRREALTVRDSSCHRRRRADDEVHGLTLFVGGLFTRASDRSRDVLPCSRARASCAHIPDAAHPGIVTTLQVLSAASDSSGGWFLGGASGSAGRAPCRPLLHVRGTDRSRTGRRRRTGVVTAKLFTAGRLFVAGAFTTIGGQPRRTGDD